MEGTEEVHKGFWCVDLRGKRSFGKSRCGRDDNIKWIFKKWNRGSVYWIDLAQVRTSGGIL
jgi:hypothetical protein